MIVEKHYVQILKSILELSNEQIWIGSQNVKILNTDGLFVIVSVVDAEVLSNTSRFEYSRQLPAEFKTATNYPLWEALLINVQPKIGFLIEEPTNVIETVIKYNVQVDLVSKDNSARDIRGKALGAFASFYSQKIQEQYQFRIFPISSVFINTTELEGGSQLNRFTIIIPSLYLERNTANTDYYDTFSENTIF